MNIAIAILAMLLLVAPAAAEAISVSDFGAVGDGKADDTAAIQAALDRAGEGPAGSSVHLPAGRYRITSSLRVESVLLHGLPAGGWPADRSVLPLLLVDFTDGPAIIAGHAASIHGIGFDYDHAGEEAREFGPAILLTGIGISLTNLKIHQPYEGIIADGTSNIGRLNIENVFIISARKTGVYVTGTFDIATLRNIEVWNPADYSLDNCVGFKLGMNDEIRLDNCFAFKCRIGFLFIEEERGKTWGGMSNCSVDFSIEGVVVEAADVVRINGGSFWAHHRSLVLDGPGRVIVSGADLKANGDSALVVRDCTSLTITGCTLGKSGDEWPDVPAARIEGGGSVLLTGCTFDRFGPGIYIGENAGNFLIANNIFQSERFESIIDRSADDAKKVIEANLQQ